MKIRTQVQKFRVIVADPTWPFGDKLGKRGSEAKYKTQLSLDEIKQFPLPPLADDCVLFLWRVASMTEEAHEVARAWGFTPNKGELVWRKMTSGGKEHFGMGYIVRGAHETCVIATRGRASRMLKRKNQRSIFSAPVPVDEDGRAIHSAKPDEFFEIVCSMFDGPRVSLFERSLRDGFVCIGDEMESAA